MAGHCKTHGDYRGDWCYTCPPHKGYPVCGYWDFDRDERCARPAIWVYKSPRTLKFLCDRCKAAVVEIAPSWVAYMEPVEVYESRAV